MGNVNGILNLALFSMCLQALDKISLWFPLLCMSSCLVGVVLLCLKKNLSKPIKTIKARFFSDSFDSLGSTNPSFDEGCVRGAALWRCGVRRMRRRFIRFVHLVTNSVYIQRQVQHGTIERNNYGIYWYIDSYWFIVFYSIAGLRIAPTEDKW